MSVLSVCAVRVIAESDVMQDFLAASDDNIVSSLSPSILLNFLGSLQIQQIGCCHTGTLAVRLEAAAAFCRVIITW